ncbi:aspartate:alanine exchanger family transporter [Actinomyces minihominis]|uniref:aspartate:alanine exchanger family transporter n=1 Tax=Actinomyces minihominis TaxID=2002838 RepID=UPI000C073C3D|nr:TrkA C-terminal domain-containing protein [Actinomyces minihominis]
MTDFLVGQPLLTLFIVLALGAALGAIRVGPLRLGAAGALFVALTFSAINPDLAEGFGLVQQIGLALFVYTVGIASGATIGKALRTNMPLMIGAIIASVLGGITAALLGNWFELPSGLSTGLFTGALTAAPALDAATRLVGGPEAAVGYSTGYPMGVIVGVIVVTLVAGLRWQGGKDTPPLAGRGLHALTVRVTKTIQPKDIPEWADQTVRFSYVRREGTTRVLVPGEELREGDEIVVVGEPGGPELVLDRIGVPVAEHLADDRSEVEFVRIVLSNDTLPGHTVSELSLPSRYGAVVTRVRRGDLDLLAREDLPLQAGDALAVVVPREEVGAVKKYLGDSQRSIAEMDSLSIGIGLVLGILVGMVSIPLPGGTTFELGGAAGPLLVGMILGALRRTGPLVWSMPDTVNLTVRHLGMLLFLSALGLSAGPAVASLLSEPMGFKAILLATIVAVVGCVVMVVAGRVAGLSAARTAGGVAGFLGQPAVFQAADARVRDERIESAYSTLFALAILVKILLVPLVWMI